MEKKVYSIIIFIILAVINVLFGYLSLIVSGTGLNMFCSTYGFVPFTYISAFAGVGCVVVFSKWITNKCIRYIGEYSIIYYVFHQTVMMPIAARIIDWWCIKLNLNLKPNVGTYTIVWLLTILLLCSMCSGIVSSTKLKIVLGK